MTTMLNHLPINRTEVILDVQEYAEALAELAKVEDQICPLSRPQLVGLIEGAAGVLLLLGARLHDLEVERRRAWSIDGDTTRHDALDEALALIGVATAAIPPDHLWPESLAFASRIDEDDE